MNTARQLESLDDLKQVLDAARTIAVVGISEKPERDSHSISAYLQQNGYRLVCVNPKAATILGERCHPSLSAIPEEVRRGIDLVAIFRHPDDVPQVIEEAAALGLEQVWIVPGASSPAALKAAAARGLTVVADKCLRVTHQMTRPRHA